MSTETGQTISKNTPPDILYETFMHLQEREEKMKEHLKVALSAQKVASESYHKEKKARETFQHLCEDLGEKCTMIQKNTTTERERMFTLFKDQSERIDVQVKKLSADNDGLMQENIKYREQLNRVLNASDDQNKKLKFASEKWLLVNNDLKQQLIDTKKENEKLCSELQTLIRGAIDDKTYITTLIKSESETREILKVKTVEFSKMFDKCLEQAKYTTELATDMKKMRKELNGLKKNLTSTEHDRIKAETAVLSIGKEKLEGDLIIREKNARIAKLEDLVRALNKRSHEESNKKEEVAKEATNKLSMLEQLSLNEKVVEEENVE